MTWAGVQAACCAKLPTISHGLSIENIMRCFCRAGLTVFVGALFGEMHVLGYWLDQKLV